MRAAPIDLIGGFYQDDSLPWACQDTVNWIPEAAEAQGTRTPSILRDAPGLRPKVQVGTGPIRGMRNVEGKLLVVSGTQLYQITNDLVSIPRGNIPGTGMVSMAHNSRSGGNQVVIVNGAAGYVYDTNALTLTRITDAGYPGAFVVDFVDGYMAQIEPLRRYWFHSELTQALDYNTLDRYPAEGQPDALVTLLVDHREVWVFGERTIEPFVNTGAATNTFARASNTVIENGCSAKFSPAKLDNSIFWLDDLGIVRRAQGYTATRVSTSAIEQAIADLDWKRAFGFTITERGHAIYYLTFPDGYTFGFDIVTGLWHRRASYGLDRWRVAAVAYWNGEYVCGDFQQGLLYGLDWDYPYDGVLPHVRERVTGVTHDNQTKVLVPYAELIVDNGRALVASVEAPEQPTGPSITGDAPSGSIDTAYSYAYTPTGGEAPLVVALAPGSDPLPPGLTLSSLGVLSGTPTTDGSFSWTVRVTDANGLYDDLDDTADISSALPTLMTSVRHYIGAPETLAVAVDAVGWDASTTIVRMSPNGLYAVGTIPGDAGAGRFQFRKFDPVALTWSAITLPASLPTIGPLAMEWSPDGGYFACAVSAASPDNLIVYKLTGDTLTKLADPVDTLPDVATGIGWDTVGGRLAVGNGNGSAGIYVWDFVADALVNRRTASTGAAPGVVSKVSFQAGAGSRYLLCGNTAAVAIVDTTTNPMTVQTAEAVNAGVGVHWDASGAYVITVAQSSVTPVAVYDFDDTLGSENLTFNSYPADQPATTPSDSRNTYDRAFIAIARASSQVPLIYDLATIPTLVKEADPPTTGANIGSIDWGTT